MGAMRFAYDAVPWANFFFAEVGASAALVGLLFVAVSINLARIIEYPALPGRAFEALVVLVMVLFVGTFALVPGQSTFALGAEVVLTASAAWATTVIIQHRAPIDPAAPRSWTLSRVVTTQVATLPMIVAGASLLVGRGGGLYWTVFGVIAAFVAALIDAWVLLVEIQR
jgi:modulator of FtsH protease